MVEAPGGEGKPAIQVRSKGELKTMMPQVRLALALALTLILTPSHWPLPTDY